MINQSNRSALIEHAKKSIEKGSKSFALASKVFDSETREKVILFYTWCRKCDDIIDGQDHGHNAHVMDSRHENIKIIGEARSRKFAKKRIAILRNKTQAALSGHITDDPAFDALAIIMRECKVDRKYIDDIINGFALDADEWRPRNENDLYQYCYHVAGAVGIVMAQIMGIDADDGAILDRACDLGIAFQLANISRDIAEDDSNGRCYIPIDWLVEMDIEPGQHMRPHYRPKLAKLAAKMCKASAQYAASARIGANALPFRSRWAVLAASDIYIEIANQVLNAGESAWDKRIYSNKITKLIWLSKAFFKAQKQVEESPRTGLWNR